ncbi:MAG: hypothetical protein HOO95_07380 [Gallionella sp.]|nr:hypothetical protein [Gallionella sp.]
MLKIALLTLGVLLCPAYYIYFMFFTGQVIHAIPLVPAQQGFQPVTFSVEPKSNPIRFVLQVSTEHLPLVQTTPPTLRYLVTVKQADSTSMSYKVQLNALLATERELKDFNQTVVTLPVVAAGNITVSVQQTEPSQMSTTKGTLIVKERVLSANMSVVGLGAALLTAGVLMLFAA